MKNQPQPTLHFRYFDLIMVGFVVVLMLSNIATVKPLQAGPFQVAGDLPIFAISYIFGDILTEVYGYARSRRVIWTGFAALTFMALFFMLVVRLPAATDWTGQEAFAATLGPVPRIVLASICAFFLGEFCNSYVLARLKIMTQGRYLWTRTIGSTLVGQTVDTTIFVLVAFLGTDLQPFIVPILISGIVTKVLYETLATPVTYAIVNYLKRAEGVDHFDTATDFNPFTLELNDQPTPTLAQGSRAGN